MSRRDDLLTALRARVSGEPVDVREAFAASSDRFKRFSARQDDLLVDYSKCAVDDGVVNDLLALASEMEVFEKRDAMFRGERINSTEDRSVLHTALRDRESGAIHAHVEGGEGENVVTGIRDTLDRMSEFAAGIRDGSIVGTRDRRITDVVNIGIGGSDLGPAMATQALRPYHDGPRVHFVSNVDGAHMADTLRGLLPATTLFIVASKTFTTIETMTNARTARDWCARSVGEENIGLQFAAVSTATDKVAEFGIPEERTFGFGEWVGGRYSLWSAIGLPLMIAIGPERFRELLDGGYAIDRNFRQAEGKSNLALMLGLIGYWHRAVCGYPTRALIPYDQRLSRFPAYVQQLDMESNGKGVTIDGAPVEVSGPIVFGEPGTNGQHAFFQLLHQGTDVVPVEFVVAAHAHERGMDAHHQLLLANCFAQSEALMRGRSEDEAFDIMRSKGMDEEEARRLAPHRAFTGRRPSVTIMYDKLTPFSLGRLIALYEHRVFVEGALYGVNSFDQWGVELGKELATALLPVVQGEETGDHDGSTLGLVAHARSL